MQNTIDYFASFLYNWTRVVALIAHKVSSVVGIPKPWDDLTEEERDAWRALAKRILRLYPR